MNRIFKIWINSKIVVRLILHFTELGSGQGKHLEALNVLNEVIRFQKVWILEEFLIVNKVQ